MNLEINPPRITDYCVQHSTQPSKLCVELEKFTLENVPASVMLSGPLVGSFLGFWISHLRASRVLEVGTYTGYSALCMAERLPVDGRLITLDVNGDTTLIAKRFWERSSSGSKIQLIFGDARKTLANLRGPFDFVFIDADKAGYVYYLERALDVLAPTGVIVCDNALYDGEVLDPETASENGKALAAFNEYVRMRRDLESVLLPVRDGLMVVRKQ